MKSFISTVVGGMIGLAALYVVGKIAYQAGRDVAEAECHYNDILEKTNAVKTPDEEKTDDKTGEPETDVESSQIVPAPETSHKPKSGMMNGLKYIVGKKSSVIRKLLSDPEGHRVEAFIDGEELKVSVKPRTA